jgi:hypothetical protein
MKNLLPFALGVCVPAATAQEFTILAQQRSIYVEAMAADFDGIIIESDFVESEELFNFNESLPVEAELGGASAFASASQASLLDPSLIEVTADMFTEAIAEGKEAKAYAAVESLGSLTFSVDVNVTVSFSGSLSIEGGDSSEMAIYFVGTDGNIFVAGVGAGETVKFDERIDLKPGKYQLINEHLAEGLPIEEAIFGEAIVTIGIAIECSADVNGDGMLNILDFVAFQELFVNQDPDADCDGNGIFDILDFICYQIFFQEGCG